MAENKTLKTSGRISTRSAMRGAREKEKSVTSVKFDSSTDKRKKEEKRQGLGLYKKEKVPQNQPLSKLDKKSPLIPNGDSRPENPDEYKNRNSRKLGSVFRKN